MRQVLRAGALGRPRGMGWGGRQETRSERDTCTPMFIAALFIIARTRKQPRCPSGDEWIRKLWYIYTMEYYSAIKKWLLLSQSTGSRHAGSVAVAQGLGCSMVCEILPD